MRINDVIRLFCGSVAVYVVVAACSGKGSVSSASADDNQNGSRLKVQRYVGSDGSSFTAGLYDSQLGTPCSYGAASDGSIRCLPMGSPYGPLAGAPLFADSACTEYVVFSGGGAGQNCSVAKYTLTTLSCGSDVYQPTVYTGSLYARNPTGCVAAPSSDTKGQTPYVLGTALPPSTFVAGTLTTDS
jgi:hypothetical protein